MMLPIRAAEYHFHDGHPPARGLPAAEALLERTRVSGWAFDVEWAGCARARD